MMGDGDGDGDMVRLLDDADVSWLGFWLEDMIGMGSALVGGVFHIICMVPDCVYIYICICYTICFVMCVVRRSKASEDNNMRDPILNI